MSNDTRAVGLAALSICESLLLSLTECGILGKAETAGILKDAASAHRNAASTAVSPEPHQRAADLIDRIVKKRNSISGPSNGQTPDG